MKNDTHAGKPDALSLPKQLDDERLNALRLAVRGMVHEFNNYLTPIHGFTDLLLMELDKEQAPDREALREEVVTIMDAVRQAEVFIRKLRRFYRHDQPPGCMVELLLNDFVAQTRDELEDRCRQRAAARQVKLRLEYRLDPTRPIAANEEDLRDLLAFLLDNAVDASAAGEQVVQITTRDCGDEMCLAVRDQGCGMTPEVMKHCLDPFFSTRKQTGAGMGLAQVYGIVEGFHGRITVSSEVGKGTEFQIFLPPARFQIREGVRGPDGIFEWTQ